MVSLVCGFIARRKMKIVGIVRIDLIKKKLGER